MRHSLNSVDATQVVNKAILKVALYLDSLRKSLPNYW